jgi:AAA+ superfamily predicted ATPase
VWLFADAFDWQTKYFLYKQFDFIYIDMNFSSWIAARITKKAKWFFASSQWEDFAASKDTASSGSKSQLDKSSWIDSNQTDVAPIQVQASVQKQVESVIESSEIQKLRYFLMELIRRNTWIISPSVVASSSYKSRLTVWIPWKFKGDTSIQSIIINESIRLKQTLTDNQKIKIWNMFIELDRWYLNEWGFKIELSWKFDENNMELMRDFFERAFMPEYVVNEQWTLHIPQIRSLLELEEKDFVSLNGKILEISIPLEHEIIIDNNLLDTLASGLNNSYDDYSIKHKRQIASRDNSIGFGRLVICDIRRQYDCYVQWEFSQWKLTIRLGNEYNKLEIDKKFIETVFKKLIFLMRQNNQKTKNYLQSLKDVGVIVYEKDPNEERKTLDQLYEEDGFVGYEDIKEILASDIVYPWEQKDEYIRVAKEKFPHMKNIIPNTALFEWPPGTGKTTQAKIIGKYLGYPFIYVPIGKLMSKWYGESEWRLDKIFELAGKAAKEHGGIIMMIDEIDEIGKNRDDSHEATGRITWVLLKKLDGIEQVANLLLIGSTNRKESLDPALLSRFSRQVFFRLPNTEEIRHILSFYIPEAKNLSNESLAKLVWKSGRDLKNIAEDVARKYLEQEIILKQKPDINMVLDQYTSQLQVSIEAQ